MDVSWIDLGFGVLFGMLVGAWAFNQDALVSRLEKEVADWKAAWMKEASTVDWIRARGEVTLKQVMDNAARR